LSEAEEPTDPAEIREELFRALCERTNDLLVQSRIRAAVVELRLQEGVSARPLRGYRAEDPLLDLLLRLLGVGDDVTETELRDPLDVAAERAAWIATREIPSNDEEVGAEAERLPNYVIASEAEAVEEHIVIGWQPTDDDLEALARDLEAIVQEPPPPLDMSEDGLSAMVSFQAADAVARAQEDARQEALGVYSGPRYPSLATKGETEEVPNDAAAAALTTEERPPTEGDDERPAFLVQHPDVVSEPAQSMEGSPAAQPPSVVATSVKSAPQSQAVASDPSARPVVASAPRDPLPQRPMEEVRDSAPMERVANRLDAGVSSLALVAAALVVFVLFLGGAYMGGQRMQGGQQRADVTRAKLYNAIAMDDNLVRDMVELGADGPLLQRRYQQFVIAKEPQKARRALALSRALEMEIQGTRTGSVRARQLEQVVQHIGSARLTYTHSVEAWASSTQGLLGGLAMTLRFGAPPASDAILPLE